METSDIKTTTQPATPTPPPLPPTPPHRETRRPQIRLSYRVLILGVLGVLIVLGVVVVFLTRETMPEDRLYRVKTEVFEPAVGIVRVSDRGSITYDEYLLTVRLAELEEIVRTSGTTSPEIISQVGTLISRHTEDVVSTIQYSSLPLIDRLEALSRIVVIVRLIETRVREFPELEPLKTALDVSRESLDTLESATVESLMASADGEVLENYLKRLVSRVSLALPTIGRGSDAERRVANRIESANDAILANDLEQALTDLLRALETISLYEHLSASERGEAAPLGETLQATTTEGQ